MQPGKQESNTSESESCGSSKGSTQLPAPSILPQNLETLSGCFPPPGAAEVPIYLLLFAS